MDKVRVYYDPVGRTLNVGLAEESPLLAGLAAASVAGRAALGAEAGARTARLGLSRQWLSAAEDGEPGSKDDLVRGR